MTPIKPVRDLFLRDPVAFPWGLVVLGLIVLGFSAAAMLGWRIKGIEFPAVVIAPDKLVEYRSADGKVICYKQGSGLSCIPVWMLDPPQSWFAIYKKEKGK